MNKRTKKLTLNKETLKELGTRELARAQGGNSGGYSGCASCGGANLKKGGGCFSSIVFGC